jgi:cytochrome c553
MAQLRPPSCLVLQVVLAVAAAFCAGMASAAPAVYQPLQYRTETWQGSTFWGNGDWARVGKDWQHPGDGIPVVRRFTMPADGKVTISGRAYKLDVNGGDGVQFLVRLDDRAVWAAEIGPRDATGVVPALKLDVKKGQSLRFIVAPRGTHFCDSTHWDPVVTYPDGAKHQASSAFCDKAGAQGWAYEMEVLPGKRPTTPPVPAASLPNVRGLDLPAMVEVEWRHEDRIDPARPDYVQAVGKHLSGAQRLLADLGNARGKEFLAAEQAELDSIAEQATDLQRRDEQLYLRLRRLKRRIALANPLLNFDKLFFVKRVPGVYSHLVMQHYGFFARPGGGLFVLEKPGHSMQFRDILAGKLAEGNVVEPQLSYDGRKVLFSFVRCTGRSYDINKLDNRENHDFYHIYEVNADGTGLRQVTDEPYDDLMPNYLPDGSIVFCSTRRQAHARCFHRKCGTRWQTYTLYRMDADGKNIRPLSFHDTNEWYPSVAHDGQILYARWDYIDRDAVTHQNLWATRPDGTAAVAVWGNEVPNPHCTFQAKAVPGSQKIVFIASAHHSLTAGPVVLLDSTVDRNSAAALHRVTPDVPFPESEGQPIEYYSAPWPLSEKYFLVSYSPVPLVFEPGINPRNALGLYLLDAFGNRELIYRDPDISSTNPIPLATRPRPPVLPSTVAADAPPVGTMLLGDVYRGLGDVPRGHIRQLRIVQIFPKTTPYQNEPPIGIAREENSRAILGTVPVEEDGSAYFELPAGKAVLFQALDKDGFAFQTMRTITYVQPGERAACAGCHENRMTSVAPKEVAAVRRAPSTIEPGPMGGAPFSFVRFVQPVLDKHCVRCHGGEKTEKGVNLSRRLAGGFTESYVALTRDLKLVPRYAMRNNVQFTLPGGANAALGSGLMKLLRAGHEDVKLSDDDMRRLATWIDLNAVFYGSYDPKENIEELSGRAIPMPVIQ